MNTSLSYDLLERLSNLLRAEERRFGKELQLEPVHLRTLRFLSRANRYSDTPVAVAEYLGLTKGTASQTLRRLQEKDLVVGVPDGSDGRKVHQRLTPKGRGVVRKVSPPDLFERALQDSSVTKSLAFSLQDLLRALQRLNDSKSFGVCHTCIHFETLARPGRQRCGLTGETLKLQEIDLLCREHELEPEPPHH